MSDESSEILPRILVVDDSRMVRASLVKNLKGHFDIREEADGEAAWQTLILDQSLAAVISDLQMPKLDGYGLLERVRTSKLRRLQQIPFILVSGAESEEERSKAKAMGVSDFITKGIGTAEILTRLNHLLELSKARERIEQTRTQLVQNDKSGMYTRKYIELHVAQALSHAARHGGEVSVIVLGLDNYNGICSKVGNDLAEQVATRFAQMLGGKMRREDSLGHYDAGQYVIVSPGISPAHCASFAERVREAVSVAHVVAQGQKISLTISAGVANAPDDHVVSAGSLLELAANRMREAVESGGNRIVSGGAGAEAVREMPLLEALEAIRAGHGAAVLPHLAVLGLQIAPLLRLIDQECKLNLPMAEYEYRLGERVQRK
ncbi:MAG TPA: diguanylate cyclase [Rhodocyclaceae bacterium]|nr:diguanylate cyclase [Rhodocyclaceae bacterium]